MMVSLGPSGISVTCSTLEVLRVAINAVCDDHGASIGELAFLHASSRHELPALLNYACSVLNRARRPVASPVEVGKSTKIQHSRWHRSVIRADGLLARPNPLRARLNTREPFVRGERCAYWLR